MIPVYTGTEALDKLKQIQCPEEERSNAIEQSVQEIISIVRAQGDEGLKSLAARFGDTVPDSFRLSESALQSAIQRIPEETQILLKQAASNISGYAEAVANSVQPVHLKQAEFEVGLDWAPVERVACYVPGGRYPLPSTALMTTLTAQAAGVSQIVLVSPQLKDEIIYAGHLAGVTEFYQLGGAQAVAAMAYGTQSIQVVDMLVGPGNAYVTEAKRQLQGVIGIDMLAGPSEVAIIADEKVNPNWVALDLLAQAEHDPLARAYLFTPSLSVAQAVAQQILLQCEALNLPAFVQDALQASGLFVLPDLSTCIDAANAIAPEHLELLVEEPEQLKTQLNHYGGLFMGYHTPVPFGDYMAGPNHTLPTNRTARFSGPLTPLTFMRPQSWIKASQYPSSLAQSSKQFALLEGLQAHAASAASRVN